MLKVLKWVLLVAFGLFALVALLDSDKTVQSVVFAGFALGYMIYGVAKQVESLHKDATNRLERLYQKVDEISNKCFLLEQQIRDLERVVTRTTA